MPYDNGNQCSKVLTKIKQKRRKEIDSPKTDSLMRKPNKNKRDLRNWWKEPIS